LSESLKDYADQHAEVLGLREALRTSNQQLREAKNKRKALVEAVFAGARDALLTLGPIEPVKTPPKDRRKAKPEAALWHLTDWQLAKVTPSYNSDVARKRVEAFCQKATKITEIARADHPVPHCVIAFGGDMVEGLFNFPTQPFEIDQTLFGQFVTAARLQVDVIRHALSIYENVTVIAEPGNHGRLGNKNVVLPRSDNLDRMTYELARQQLLNESRLSFDKNHGVEDIQRIEIGNYRALLIHGDEVGRGGFASPTTILQHCNRWKAGSYDWDFRDVYVGHYHNHMELSLADGTGAVYWTGSTESENHYARDTMAASATPSQRLHFVDTEKGMVTSQYRILLDM
jgi:hypothetical protein